LLKDKLKAKDKTTQKMSRGGLIEQNLSTGEKLSITNRQQDFSLKNPTDNQPTPQLPAKNHKPRAAPQSLDAADSPPDLSNKKPSIHADKPTIPNDSPVKYTRESKLRHAEAKVESTEKKLNAVRKKQPHKKRLVSDLAVDEKTQKLTRRLHFEDAVVPQKPNLLKKGARAAGNIAALKIHSKLYQVEGENIGIKAAHRSEMGAEGALRVAAHSRRARHQRLAKKAVRLEKTVTKAKINLNFEQAVKKNPVIAKQNALRKFMQKRALRKKYIKQAQKTAKQAAKKARQTEKTSEKVISFAVRHPILTLLMCFLLFFVMLFQSCTNSCMTFVSGGGGVLLGGFYPAEDVDINQAELYYTEKETDLYFSAYDQKNQHPGYDEYRYNIGDISHNPYELMAYLSAVYQEFSFDSIKGNIDSIFNEQYSLTTQEIIEKRTDGGVVGETDVEQQVEYDWRILVITVTAKPLSSVILPKMDDEQKQMYTLYMESRGGHFYFSPPFDFSWTDYMSSGYGWRVHPISNDKKLHDGVDIAVAAGTPVSAVQNGVVTFAGVNGGYGNCVIIEDGEGLKSLYGHLSVISVANGQKITHGDKIGEVGSTGNSTGPHLHLSVYKDGVNLNPLFFVDPGKGGMGGNGIDPGDAYDDETFQKIMTEAKKYIGMTYVFGGSSPSTGFDCSGYVCWVYRVSGVYDMGRIGATGIYNHCAPVTDPKPGDLVFFHTTYSTAAPVTHVGIYVGDGKMLHCGNPIGYANLSNSYWQAHFLGYGRLPIN
jgi:murein DD-endopeptidase MepM/ murein hydrolase activator NlpD